MHGRPDQCLNIWRRRHVVHLRWRCMEECPWYILDSEMGGGRKVCGQFLSDWRNIWMPAAGLWGQTGRGDPSGGAPMTFGFRRIQQQHHLEQPERTHNQLGAESKSVIIFTHDTLLTYYSSNYEYHIHRNLGLNILYIKMMELWCDQVLSVWAII